MSQVVLVGGGGHAKVVAAILRRSAELHPVGYTDLVDRGPLVTLPYLGDDSVLAALIERHPDTLAAIGLGSLTSTAARRALTAKMRALGFRLPSIVAPTALVAEEAAVEPGAQALDRVTVNPGAHVGACAILNTGSIVEHDVIIGEFSHLAPGATVCGGARLGPDVFVGAGAVVVHGVTVGRGCVVGAGSVLTRDADEPGVYVGVPARRIG